MKNRKIALKTNMRPNHSNLLSIENFVLSSNKIKRSIKPINFDGRSMQDNYLADILLNIHQKTFSHGCSKVVFILQNTWFHLLMDVVLYVVLVFFIKVLETMEAIMNKSIAFCRWLYIINEKCLIYVIFITCNQFLITNFIQDGRCSRSIE